MDKSTAKLAILHAPGELGLQNGLESPGNTLLNRIRAESL